MTLNDFIKYPRKDWDKEHWLKHAYVMVHSPWINEDDRDYWKDMIEKYQSEKRPQGLYKCLTKVYNK